ncbi:MAG TPA: hypothetical protein DCL15_12785 [Chloroflexi bacterium]|nr:hypothetical protein [Chloroflexota bacterium]HHW84738.1 hypothetical protein [Chloroflexota bacterium]
MAEKEKEERELTGLYAAVHSGIWLIGLAVLFYTDNWFPGILILVAISGIAQALLQMLAKREEARAQAAQQARAAALAVPATCPTCGAAINASTVVWSGVTTAHCPYCKAAIPLK